MQNLRQRIFLPAGILAVPDWITGVSPGRQSIYEKSLCLARITFPLFASVLVVCVAVTEARADHIDGPLYSVPQVKTGWHTGGMDFGDVNGDHLTDAVTPNTTDETLSILLGDGEGGFTLSHSIPAGTHPAAVALDDFSGDGRIDIMVADREDNTVQIMLGDGAGHFTPGASLTVNAGPMRLETGDFNGDHLPDLAVVHLLNGISILSNNAGAPGTFTVSAYFEFSDLGGLPVAIDVGDVDGDGDTDLAASLAVSGGRDGVISILLNDGTGVFTTGTTIVNGRRGDDLTFVDFDGDGDPDIAAVDDGHNITIAQNLGAGVFSAAVPHAISGVNDATSVDSADIDGDGRDEIVAVWDQHSTSGRLTVMDREETGAVSIESYIITRGPRFVRAVGIDGDGRPDIVFLSTLDACPNRFGCLGQGSMNVLLNRGLAGFGNYSTTSLRDGPIDTTYATFNSDDTVAADFDGDGYKDIAIVDREFDQVAILGNDGYGRFHELQVITGHEGPFSLAAADFDDDGDTDLVFSTLFTEWYLARNRGDGTFDTTRIHLGYRSPVLTAEDMDGDGDIDLFASSGIPIQLGYVEVLFNDGAGNFSPSLIPDRPEEGTHRHAIVDIDNDGDLDAIMGQELRNGGVLEMSLLVYKNNGDATFATPVKIPLGEGGAPVGVAAGDIDNDGDSDIVLGDADNAVIRILRNTAGTLSPAATLAASPEIRDVEIADLDQDGRLDIIAANGIVADYDGTVAIPEESIQVWYGESTGGFSATQHYMSGWYPRGITVDSFTDSGKQDIAVYDGRDGELWVLKRLDVLPGLRVDIDLDGLSDFLEIELNLDFTDPDSDNDGLLDGIDPSIIAGLIEVFPISSFRTAGQKQSLISQQNGVEQKVFIGQTRQAIDQLQQLGSYYDGCLTTKDPDFNDWVRDCNAQFRILNLQDVVLTNLKSTLKSSFP